MFSPGTMFRTAVNSSRSNAIHALRARACTSSLRNLPGTSFSLPSAEGRRYISAYGYTQAKALVYSKYGEPKDVLQYVFCFGNSPILVIVVGDCADKILYQAAQALYFPSPWIPSSPSSSRRANEPGRCQPDPRNIPKQTAIPNGIRNTGTICRGRE